MLIDQAEFPGQMQPQPAQHVMRDPRLVGHTEEEIARPHSRQGAQESVRNQKLCDDGVQLPVLGDLDPGQAFRPPALRDLPQGVDPTARGARPILDDQRLHDPALGDRLPEHLELGLRRKGREVFQRHLEAQVRLVRAVPAHHLPVGQPREGRGQGDAACFLEYPADHLLGQAHDLLTVHKRQLQIDLSELRLAIEPECGLGEERAVQFEPLVFVAETPRNLVIAVHAAHHQDLLEHLWRLRKRKKAAGVHATGHQVITGAFRRALGEHGGFDFKKSLRIQEGADLLRDRVAKFEQSLHLGTAQIEIPVLQPKRLGHVDLVFYQEGRRPRVVEDLGRFDHHLDLAGDQVRIRRSVRPSCDDSPDRDDIFAAQRVGLLMSRWVLFRIEHNLRDPLSIPKIDEHDCPMIPPAMDPPVQHHGLADMGLRQLATAMRSHLHALLRIEPREG